MFGIGRAVKKYAKKALGFATKVTGIGKLYKLGKGLWDDLTGKTAAKDMAKQQEQQLLAQAEQAKLNAANEIGNVTQFDESPDVSFSGSTGDKRRKRRSAGAYASGIGLSI